MTDQAAPTRYPGYDVLNKRDSPSWDAITRKVVDERLAMPEDQPRFLAAGPWRTAKTLCACLIAQPDEHPPIPVAAMLDTKLFEDSGDGFRNVKLPPLREAWQRGLAALDAESQQSHGAGFADLSESQQHQLLQRAQHGELRHDAWKGMPSALFFSDRVLHDLYGAYYSHPSSWSEIGFGGPANPRGYVRMAANRRDSWEPIEVTPNADREAVRRENARVR